MSESKLREQICVWAKSLFDRGLTGGASGNISVRTSEGGFLVSPTGSSFGNLDPAQLSRFDEQGNHIDGLESTKEMPLHMAFYETRPSARAVLHLHTTHAVALSMLPGADTDNFLPPLTPYSIMRLGKVKLLPYFRPGDPEIGIAIRDLNGKRSAVMLANHGPVVSAKNLEAAVYAMEEFEETAKLALILKGSKVNQLSSNQVQDLVSHFNLEWE